MKITRRSGLVHPASPGEVAALRARLAEAEEALRAVRAGEVDSVRVAGRRGAQVFTLEGAEHTYRTLIEGMNEGALTVMSDKTILYANQCFARMVKCPLEQLIGSSLRRFLSVADQASLRPLLKRPDKAGAKVQLTLIDGGGAQRPAQVSIRPLARGGAGRSVSGVVVTDMTEARRSEEMLRALTHRVVQVQEAERGRLALELHDHITQLLCAVQLRSRALVDSLSARSGRAKEEALKLREMVGRTAEEVERISRGLRPGVLEQLGLAVVLRSAGREFDARTGVHVAVDCAPSAARLPAAAELAFYRLFQEALKNVQQHAHARHVAVRLSFPGASIRLSITDDGIGFDAERRPAEPTGTDRLGLLVMRERVEMVGGTFTLASSPGHGTTIQADIPIGPPPPATNA